MLTLKIAFRSLMRRKVRVAMIGLLVVLGTILIVFGETFSLSAKHFSREAIIQYFTGDVIIYSARSKDLPSPFSFTTALPVLNDPGRIEAYLASNSAVAAYVSIAQNYGLLSVTKRGKKFDVPFIFYAVDPLKYAKTFSNAAMLKGSFFSAEKGVSASGVVLSAFQVKNYATNYSIDISVGDSVTLLSLTEGGSVNAYPSKILGIYEPRFYKNVFDYINFIDITSYSRLYNFTGVDASSLPSTFNKALASDSDDAIFGIADSGFQSLDTKKLVSRELTGYTMIAVKLKDHRDIGKFTAAVKKQGFDVKTALWNEASSFFANVAGIIQSVIIGASALIFLIVVFILMNTLIINVLERTGEIGTLRAMGGEKSFITSIFLWESFFLNGIAALIGMAVSIILIVVIGMRGIALPPIMADYLVGGGTLKLIVSARPFIEAFLIIVAVSVLATLYPIRVATKITPLKAMSDK